MTLTDRHMAALQDIQRRLVAELERIQDENDTGEATVYIGYRDGAINKIKVTTTENVPLAKGA